ncbi:MAG: hypothetical protein WA957_05905, partial [Alteraurantiacibacter sp.]
AHIRVMDQVLPALAQYPEYQREVQRLHNLATESRAFSEDPAHPAERMESAPPAALHPLSVAYVIFGSRLGSRVIAADLKRQDVPWPQAAIAYFTDDQTRAHWQHLVQVIKDYEDQEDRIVSDSVLTFELFLSEAREARALLQSSK